LPVLLYLSSFYRMVKITLPPQTSIRGWHRRVCFNIAPSRKSTTGRRALWCKQSERQAHEAMRIPPIPATHLCHLQNLRVFETKFCDALAHKLRTDWPEQANRGLPEEGDDRVLVGIC
jgi:hypothetical protein